MSDDDEQLDLDLRARLQALHDESALPLGQDAERRVIAAVIAQHSARARNLRRGAWTVGALAAAAGVALATRMTLDAHPPQPAASLACGLPSVERGDSPRFERNADGRQVLALGRFGRVLAEPGAKVELEHASACELVIGLRSGSLAGDLQKLAPASLHVRTALGEVVVRGTRFSVRADEAAGAELEVVLLSGRVELIAPDRARTELEPGNVLRKSTRGIELAPVRPQHEQRVAALLEGERAATTTTTTTATTTATEPLSASPRDEHKNVVRSTAELLAAAEAERRQARLAQARALYREAGAREDENAEVALLRWTGLELDAGDASAARNVLAAHHKRFRKSRLRVEALWLEVRVEQALGNAPRARAAAREIVASFPNAPQALAAKRLLASP